MGGASSLPLAGGGSGGALVGADEGVGARSPAHICQMLRCGRVLMCAFAFVCCRACECMCVQASSPPPLEGGGGGGRMKE